MSGEQPPATGGTTPPAGQGTGTEQPPATGPEKPEQPPAPSTGGSVREQVAQALGDLLAAGRAKVGVGGQQAEPERDIAAEVRREVEGLQGKKERDSLLAGLKTDVETLKAAQQKAPEQVRRSERFMGWRGGE